MNRIIKFRVWDKDNECWTTDFWGHPVNTCFTLEGLIWQQFTGLLDKKKREIYDGDIVKFEIEQNELIIREVVFEYGYFGLARGKNMKPSVLWAQGNLEIIGNIFENPELLK